MYNIGIKEASLMLGVTTKTLRVWEVEGKIKSERTLGGHRRYCVSDLFKVKDGDSLTVAYARVSSHDQQSDLERQVLVLESYSRPKRMAIRDNSGFR